MKWKYLIKLTKISDKILNIKFYEFNKIFLKNSNIKITLLNDIKSAIKFIRK